MSAQEDLSPLDQLPGDLMMWVLIVSELLVFGAGLAAFLSVRILNPAGFAEAQDHLHRALAGINTLVLVTSGYFAARAVRSAEAARLGATRGWLTGAAALGAVFVAIKLVEYSGNAQAGIGMTSGGFFTFYYLLTGFHAAHVVAGIVILGLVGWRGTPRTVEVGTAFWHMVDLVWVLLFPVIYLLR